MIIFYNKKTGEIVGTVDGRIHTPEHLNIWVGDKKRIGRIIVSWKPVRWYNREGKAVDKSSPEVFAADFEPDHKQKELFEELEKNPLKVYNYRVDTKTKLLVRK